jgi:hypothetical protein
VEERGKSYCYNIIGSVGQIVTAESALDILVKSSTSVNIHHTLEVFVKL